MNRRRGFALLLTLTLLAFVVLLLVGLASYTRVETAIAGNSQRQAQARENALLALNVALDQLQKHVGPDQRVTATAEAIDGVDAQKRFYTGVWSSDPTATPTVTPQVWLASGAETATGVDVLASVSADRRVTMVGARTDGSTAGNETVAELLDITVPGVPGARGNSAAVGRYAWWVGDQGVKAPVAGADRFASIDYAPFDNDEVRQRLRQQLGFGAGATTAGGVPAFETLSPANATLIERGGVLSANQLSFLLNTDPASPTPIGLAMARANYHTWTAENYAVLANTKTGGLRQDLSIDPTLLGQAFAAWADYATYTETPTPGVSTATHVIAPDYTEPALRRRLIMTPHLFAGEASHQIGPVLTYFLMTFNVRTRGGTRTTAPMEARARWMVSFWNPYTSALVPEDLRVEVTGLPTIQVVQDPAGAAVPVGGPVGLQNLYGSPMEIALPWSTSTQSGAPTGDRQSWLPGRVYTWRSQENTTGAGTPVGGYASDFDDQTLSQAGDGVIMPLPGVVIDGDAQCGLEVNGSANLRITLYAVRPTGDVRLGTFVSADFVTSFATTPQEANQEGYQMSYVFRLAESVDTAAAPGTWLLSEGRDFRRRTVPSECYVVSSNGNDPSQYKNYSTILNPDRLLSRSTNDYTIEKDVPLFELPRAPLLTLGALQHLRMVGRRPFVIGNPWAGAAQTLNNIPVGELFDRFFFSGLTPAVTPTPNGAGSYAFPNVRLNLLRESDGTRPAPDVVRVAPNAQSSRYFLQGGGFNLNSTQPGAWASALRGIRFPETRKFTFADVDPNTGIGADTPRERADNPLDPVFFRFPHSAQEVYQIFAPPTSIANGHLFRQGLRTLDAAQTAALAGKIAELVGVKLNAADPAGGAFRSLEEFLAPNALFDGVDANGNPYGPRSLLEAAITDSGVNANIAEFSSQWLTQADVMTALAPVLFPRSDTFVIRAHGQSLNPATGAVEGRAWCEALVQRMPEYLDRADAPETPTAQLNDMNKRYGRRFKIVSFRWLTLSDI